MVLGTQRAFPSSSRPSHGRHGQTDIVIAVMGVTGVGKSHFIRELTGLDEIKVGHSLTSCTQKITAYRFRLGGLNFTMVDTPGFNDTHRSDSEVLLEIANWMELTYREDYKLSGILYLHSIVAPRMEGSSFRSLRMFRKLCGESSLKNVILTTTKWQDVPQDVGTAREAELQNTEGFWQDMIKRGAQLARFSGDKKCAQDIVLSLAGKDRITLNIQHELVEQNKSIIETEAGHAMNQELIKLQEKHTADIAAIQKECKEAIKTKDDEIMQLMHEERQRVEKKLDRVRAEQEALRIERRQEMLKTEDEWHRRLRRLESEHRDELIKAKNVETQLEMFKRRSRKAAGEDEEEDDEGQSAEYSRVAETAAELAVQRFVNFLNDIGQGPRSSNYYLM